MAQVSKPNVLLLMGDEHPVFMSGCYGHRTVKTPTIDRLAQSGVIFDAAYCPSPICSASRAAMLTGRHVHTIESWDNSSPLRSDWPTFAHSFRAAGYHTVLCGKMHFVGPDQLHGFEHRWTPDIYPTDFRWTRLNRARTAYNEGQNIDRVMEAGEGWTSDMTYDEMTLHRALAGMRQLADRPDKPFMLCVSFTSPHWPFCAPQSYLDLYDENDIDLPIIPPDYLEREHEYVKWLRIHGEFNRLVPDAVCRKARRAVMARISMLDEYLAKILARLKELCLDQNTIVAYASDHGDMMGEHGLWFKNASFDWSSRVPLILAGPGVMGRGRRIGEVVSLLDLGPTLSGLAGIEPIYPVSDGRNLTDLVAGKRTENEGLAIMENYGEGMWRGLRMIRKGRYKLNVTHGTKPELFDLVTDPGEWTNRAEDPTLAQVRHELEEIAYKNWDPAVLDERRWQSEERRKAINTVMKGNCGWPSVWVPETLT